MSKMNHKHHWDVNKFFWQDKDLPFLDFNGFYRNLVFCLNDLYQLKNCNKDNLSNHLIANGYLKRFLYLTVQFP